jgi:hypothetical protein
MSASPRRYRPLFPDGFIVFVCLFVAAVLAIVGAAVHVGHIKREPTPLSFQQLGAN